MFHLSGIALSPLHKGSKVKVERGACQTGICEWLILMIQKKRRVKNLNMYEELYFGVLLGMALSL